MVGNLKIGILALQGNFEQHKVVLDGLFVNTSLIKYPDELDSLSALIIPGGESSTISKHLDENNFRKKIIQFAVRKPIFGTCAGMILLSSTSPTKKVNPLNLMDFKVDRNGWGRQINSFSVNMIIDKSIGDSYKGYFIRSPKINTKNIKLKVLASYENNQVMLFDGKHLATSFHPEIGGDNRLHKFFLENIND